MTRTTEGNHAGDHGAWRSLYLLGAAVAVVGIAGVVLDIGLTMLPGWGPESVPSDAAGWFRQFAADPLLGLRNLDLLNVGLSVISLPLYLAVAASQRRTAPGLCAVAVTLVLLGSAVFAAGNAALPMLELSDSYATAASPQERATLEAAATGLLARGAHGSPGSYPGFLLSELGTLLMAVSMLRGRVFSRTTAITGIAGTVVLTAYSTLSTFAPQLSGAVMAIAAPGGLLMMAWNALVARRLVALARGSAEQRARRQSQQLQGVTQ